MDRFHVVSHWDTEAIPMYRLEVLPGGIHLKKADSGYAVPNSPTGNRAACALEFTGPMSMPQLAGMLTQWMTKPKPVVDRTGIGGYYLVGLKFQWPGCVPSDMERDVDTPAGALKGIGLTLTPAHDPVKVLVVDGIGPVEEN